MNEIQKPHPLLDKFVLVKGRVIAIHSTIVGTTVTIASLDDEFQRMETGITAIDSVIPEVVRCEQCDLPINGNGECLPCLEKEVD